MISSFDKLSDNALSYHEFADKVQHELNVLAISCYKKCVHLQQNALIKKAWHTFDSGLL